MGLDKHVVLRNLNLTADKIENFILNKDYSLTIPINATPEVLEDYYGPLCKCEPKNFILQDGDFKLVKRMINFVNIMHNRDSAFFF